MSHGDPNVQEAPPMSAYLQGGHLGAGKDFDFLLTIALYCLSNEGFCIASTLISRLVAHLLRVAMYWQ